MTTAAMAGEMKDVVDTAAGDERFSTLVEAVKAAELGETLKGEGPFTVFAPTNEAFEQLPEGELDSLLSAENQDQLRDILTYHVVSGQKLMSSDIAGSRQNVASVQGAELRIDASGAGAEGASATEGTAEEGMEGASAEAGAEGETAEGGTEGVAAEGAPEGGAVTVNDAQVVEADIEASNGVIHAIDGVLNPRAQVGEMPEEGEEMQEEEMQDEEMQEEEM
ncbi:fasciclin domain-containing protein [Limimonas halophila]|nr:fasciclin domain-containing protein [Limimonas halophila]